MSLYLRGFFFGIYLLAFANSLIEYNVNHDCTIKTTVAECNYLREESVILIAKNVQRIVFQRVYDTVVYIARINAPNLAVIQIHHGEIGVCQNIITKMNIDIFIGGSNCKHRVSRCINYLIIIIFYW